jgi:hypothetical protein
MIYVKSILAGVASVAVIGLLALAVLVWWGFLSSNGGGIAVRRSEIVTAGMVTLLIFVAGFWWEFRRLVHSK